MKRTSKALLVCAMCLCLGAGAPALWAQKDASTASPSVVAEEVKERTDVKNIVGIVVQIIFFLLFLGLIYYVFVYPEEGGESGGKSGGEEKDIAAGHSPQPGAGKREEGDEDGGEEKDDGPGA